MAEKLFNKFLGAESNTPHNGFDRSHRGVFSLKAGMIAPVAALHTMGNSKYSIDMEHIVRTQPLESAAFTKFSTHYEWFFVPYNYLYHSFNQILAQREDKQSTTQGSLQMPYFYLRSFVEIAVLWASYDYWMANYFTWKQGDDLSVGVRSHIQNFESMLTYNSSYVVTNVSDVNVCIRNNQQNLLYSMFENESSALNVIRTLDLLGYGNFLPIVKALAKLYNKYLFMLLPDNQRTTSYVTTNKAMINIDPTTLRSDLMKYAVNLISGSNLPADISGYFAAHSAEVSLFVDIYTTLSHVDLSANMWSVLAYNKIYEQVYRNPYYDFTRDIVESSNNPFGGIAGNSWSLEYVYLFNVDDVAGLLSDYKRLFLMFDIKYHMYHKDMFTGVLPDTQFGDVSVLVDDRSWMSLQVHTDDSSYPFDSSSSINAQLGSTQAGPLTTTLGLKSSMGSNVSDAKFRFNPALAISVLTQRRANALQRFSENMMRAGNRTSDAFRAHFGFKPLSETKNNVMFLGTFDGDIDLNVVASTTETSQLQLGQLAANGVGTISGKTIHLNSEDFGVAICCAYIHKPAEYDAYGLSKFNQNLDPFDYPYIEFQNVSLQPLENSRLGYFLSRSKTIQRVVDAEDNNGVPNKRIETLSGILGYLPSYIEYKTDVDKIHGEFYSQFPIDSYVAPRLYDDLDFRDSFAQGDFSHFVTPRSDMDFSHRVSWLYVNPNSVDNVFSVKANSAQNTDQFLFNVQFNIFASQPLSVVGLPY